MNAALLIQPPALRGESLRGYVLRLAEANFLLPTIDLWEQMFGDLGWHAVTACQQEAAAKRVGISPGMLEQLRCCGIQGDQAFCELAGHRVSVLHLRGRQCAVCPRCLSSTAAVRAEWELQHLAACADHGCWLIDKCPRCHSPLGWHRGGVATCRCGFDLSLAREVQAPERVVELARVVCERLHGDLRAQSSGRFGFPNELRSIGLGKLLSVFRLFANQRLQATSGPEPSILSATSALVEQARRMVAVSRALADWPRGWELVMRDLGLGDETPPRRVVTYAEAHSPLAAVERPGRTGVGDYPAFLQGWVSSYLSERRIFIGKRRFFAIGKRTDERVSWGQSPYNLVGSCRGPKMLRLEPDDRLSPTALRVALGASDHQMNILRRLGIAPEEADWMTARSAWEVFQRLNSATVSRRRSDRQGYVSIDRFSQAGGDGLERLLIDVKSGATPLVWRAEHVPPGLGYLAIPKSMAARYADPADAG